MSDPQDDALMHSRSGISNPLGKKTEKVRSAYVPFAVKEGLNRPVAESRFKCEAEYISYLLTVHVMGEEAMRRINEAELKNFVIKGRE